MAATKEIVKTEDVSSDGDLVAPMPLQTHVIVAPQITKPKETVRCEVCDLSFSSRSVFQSHMAGSKHQKKVKSAELLKSMESVNHEFERNAISGVIRCIVCNITVNSPQLLATHMAGNKHRSNAQKRDRPDDGSAGPPAKKPCVGGNDGQSANGAGGGDALGAKKKKKKKKAGTDSAADAEGNKPEDLKLPDFVSKLESEHGCYYFCNTCNAHCNSPLQLTQHLSSKKHEDKMRELNGGPVAHGRRGRGSFGNGPWRGPAGAMPFRGRGRGLRGDRGRGYSNVMRGRGGRGFAPNMGGPSLRGRGRGMDAPSSGAFRGASRGGNRSSRGSPRGAFDGTPRGAFDGAPRGGFSDAPRGAFDSAPRGAFDSAPRGAFDSAPRVKFEDAFDGAPRGVTNDALLGASSGAPHGTAGGSRGLLNSPGDIRAPRGNFSGRGRPGATHYPRESGYKDSEWYEESWTAASQAMNTNQGYRNNSNDWYGNESSYDASARHGLKRSYADSGAENPYLTQSWTEGYGEASARGWGSGASMTPDRASASQDSYPSGGYPSGGYPGANANEGPNRRNWREEFNDTRSSNNTNESYNRGVSAGGDSYNYPAGGANAYHSARGRGKASAGYQDWSALSYASGSQLPCPPPPPIFPKN